jgi:hypothetical protein
VKEQGRGNSALCFSKIQKNFDKSLKNPLTKSKSCAIIRMFQGDEENKKFSPQGKKHLTFSTICGRINMNKGKDTLQTRKELTL